MTGYGHADTRIQPKRTEYAAERGAGPRPCTPTAWLPWSRVLCTVLRPSAGEARRSPPRMVCHVRGNFVQFSIRDGSGPRSALSARLVAIKYVPVRIKFSLQMSCKTNWDFVRYRSCRTATLQLSRECQRHSGTPHTTPISSILPDGRCGGMKQSEHRPSHCRVKGA